MQCHDESQRVPITPTLAAKRTKVAKSDGVALPTAAGIACCDGKGHPFETAWHSMISLSLFAESGALFHQTRNRTPSFHARRGLQLLILLQYSSSLTSTHHLLRRLTVANLCLPLCDTPTPLHADSSPKQCKGTTKKGTPRIPPCSTSRAPSSSVFGTPNGPMLHKSAL